MQMTFFPPMKALEQQLATDSEIYELLSLVSHELKTPVASIKAYAGILENRLGKKKDTKNIYFLNHINEQADRITLLINRMLDINRLQAGTFVLQPTYFDFDILLSKLLTDFQHIVDSHEIACYGSAVGKVFGDEERIREVLINLITNAIRYSPGKDIIEITKRKEEGSLIVSIKDFGKGIPRSKHSQIFKRNFRIKSKGAVGKVSSGLGLYITSEIIKLHNGKIHVDSTTRKGSCFTIFLPLTN
jgi:signal transduction histidine kinase